MAETYCGWRDGSLPTESHWEKASRGIDNRDYPWGNSGYTCDFAWYHSCKLDTTVVGSLEKGKSPFGIYDAIGNVAEWVADWYSEDYYEISPVENPTGPVSVSYKVVRGSGWDDGSTDSFGVNPVW